MQENLLGLYRKAGMKGIPITFLMTDNQIVKEGFLVYINDLLSTGYVADLFTPGATRAGGRAGVPVGATARTPRVCAYVPV